MRRLVLPCALLACLLAWCAPVRATTTSTVPGSQRLAELVAKLSHKERKGQAKTNTGTTPATSSRATTTPTRSAPTTPTATAPSAPTPTTTSQTPQGESSSAAAGAIAAQLRALEAQGRHPRRAHKSSRLSGAALALAIVAGLLALCALLWAALRFAAVEPHWLLSLRHALAEAGFRASAVWSEFTDWARLGH